MGEWERNQVLENWSTVYQAKKAQTECKQIQKNISH